MTAAISQRREPRRALLAVLARGPILVLFMILVLDLGDVGSSLVVSGTTLFGVYALLDGALALCIGQTSHAMRRARGAYRFEALISMAAGSAMLIIDGLSSSAVAHVTFYGLLGGWALLSGLAQIAAALPMRHEISPTLLVLLMVTSGLARVAYGAATTVGSTVFEDVNLAIAFGGIAQQQSTILFMFTVFFTLLQLGLVNTLRHWPRRTTDF